MPKKYPVGVYMEELTSIQDTLSSSREAGFDFMCCDVLTEEYRKSALQGSANDSQEPFSWFDMSLTISDWGTSIVGMLSDFQKYTESTDKTLRERACNLMTKELGYAQHLSLVATMINLHPGDSSNFARLLYSRLANEGANHSNLVLWVRFPMINPLNAAINGGPNYPLLDEDVESSWNMWNKFRTMGNVDRRIFPVLDLPLDLPDGDDEINRWLGEHVKAICLSEEMFTTNKRGFPVLPKRTQGIIKKFFDIGSQVIINCKPGQTPEHYRHYKQYVEFLYNQMIEDCEMDPVRKYTRGYEDYLQSPLQPLMDNLEANTYEVFERDPTKYNLYQSAVGEALKQKIPDDEVETKVVTVMVVGAGRGPLVRNCLAAAESVGRKIKLFAIEKNVNAVCTLLHLKQHVWGDKVTVVSGDMRECKPDEKADILVSELLGSFGDNELSPECLDGAQSFLKEDGIMIPQSYTSFIAPVMCPKLHGDVRPFFDMNKHTMSNYETPYVVFMKNYYEIDRPKELFNFSHPKSDVSATNDRYGVVSFTAKLDCLMHGIAGYFESDLSDSVKMSIHPNTHSPGMFSWFPIYFPIREPIPVKKGDLIKVHFWRCSNKHNVWYEWSISSPTSSYVHNINGRSYTIGL